MKKLSLVVLIAVAAFGCASQINSTSQTDETSQTGGTSALEQVQSIQLPNVAGRIDHMALDSQGGRLFVELGPVQFSARLPSVAMDPVVRDLTDRAILQRAAQDDR